MGCPLLNTCVIPMNFISVYCKAAVPGKSKIKIENAIVKLKRIKTIHMKKYMR